MHVMLHTPLLLIMVSVLILHIIILVLRDKQISTIPHTYYNNPVLLLSVEDLAAVVDLPEETQHQEEEVEEDHQEEDQEEDQEEEEEEEEESGTLIVKVD